MTHFNMLIILIALSIPAIIGLYVAKNGTENSKNLSRIGLIGLATVLLIIWPVLSLYLFMGFAIGGGTPTILQIMSLALLVASPLPLAAVFSLFSAKRLKKSLRP